MDSNFIFPFISWLHTLSAESLSLLVFFICVSFLLILFRSFGVAGLYLYSAIIVVAANIQVLKVASFSFSPEPIALGTIAFATVYLASDILTEHYGSTIARKGVWLSFAAQILMTILMILTLGYPAIAGNEAHDAMMTLFIPSPRLLVASLLAYTISSFVDIFLFQWVSNVTKGRWLWLRSNIAMMVSALLDNIVFSVFAWIILNPEPVTLMKLIFTYILGTYFARVLVSFLSTPVMYLSYHFLPTVKPAHV
jgi:queuosine precursor transporter